jgi:hypothetical protein
MEKIGLQNWYKKTVPVGRSLMTSPSPGSAARRSFSSLSFSLSLKHIKLKHITNFFTPRITVVWEANGAKFKLAWFE